MQRALLLGVLLTAGAVEARTARGQSSAGFLVAYRAHQGERAKLDTGYRRHLDWHKANADSLTWHAWDVLAGPGMGLFVDGTFGKPFAALDARVNPAGDEADAVANIYPFADPVFRDFVRLRSDLSTATPLEKGMPTPFVQVVRYAASFERGKILRAAFANLRQRASSGNLLPYTVYECATCQEQVGMVLMIWRNAFATFDEASRNPDRVLGNLLEKESVSGVTSVTSEIWRYRADLRHQGRSGNH